MGSEEVESENIPEFGAAPRVKPDRVTVTDAVPVLAAPVVSTIWVLVAVAAELAKPVSTAMLAEPATMVAVPMK